MSSPAVPIVGSSRPERASGLILTALIATLFLVVIGRVAGIAGGPPPPRAGVAAPLFAAPSLHGGEIQKLEDLRGKVVLVDFWATWCPPCVASMPTLDKLHRELGARGLVVLGVNQEQGQETMVRVFMREEGLSLPVVMDSGAIATSYGVFSFPSSFLVGRDGVILAAYRGPASEGRLRADIEGALAPAEAP